MEREAASEGGKVKRGGEEVRSLLVPGGGSLVAMRLLWLALVGTAGVAALAAPEPGKIIVDDKAKNRNPAPDEKKWKPYDSLPIRLFREERVHGEVLVLSPPLFVRGPPKGFPFKRKREASPYRRESGRRNRIPESPPDDAGRRTRNPELYQSERVHGEVVVHSSPLNIKGPPKGFPLRRKARDVNNTAAAASPSESRSKSTKKPNSNKESLKRKGVKPVRGRQSMMKRLKKMWPYMLVPTMMTLGYAPFVLSSLKMFVMNALMINMMAFNAAIFLTLRNMVFGPRVGGHTKYYNFGYEHHQKQHHSR